MQLHNLKTGKVPGPENIYVEHLQHLGPDSDPGVRVAEAAAWLSHVTLPPRQSGTLFCLSSVRCLMVLDT